MDDFLSFLAKKKKSFQEMETNNLKIKKSVKMYKIPGIVQIMDPEYRYSIVMNLSLDTEYWL